LKRLIRRVLYEARFCFYGLAVGISEDMVECLVKGDIMDALILLLWIIIVAWFPNVYGLKEELNGGK
jgi:hypothetical protein